MVKYFIKLILYQAIIAVYLFFINYIIYIHLSCHVITGKILLLYFSYNGAISVLSLREAVPGGGPGDGTPVFINNVPGGLKFLRPFLFTYYKETEDFVIDNSNYHDYEIREAIFLILLFQIYFF